MVVGVGFKDPTPHQKNSRFVILLAIIANFLFFLTCENISYNIKRYKKVYKYDRTNKYKN